MTQNFLDEHHSEGKANPSDFKGQILLSSVLRRNVREIQPDGTTKFTFPTPTLTIGGTKDGLMRITRVAESYWHSWDNITPEQEGMFPVVVLDGVSHASIGSGIPPAFVRHADLKADVP